jgi:hypothetical protein
MPRPTGGPAIGGLPERWHSGWGPADAPGWSQPSCRGGEPAAGRPAGPTARALPLAVLQRPVPRAAKPELNFKLQAGCQCGATSSPGLRDVHRERA